MGAALLVCTVGVAAQPATDPHGVTAEDVAAFSPYPALLGYAGEGRVHAWANIGVAHGFAGTITTVGGFFQAKAAGTSGAAWGAVTEAWTASSGPVGAVIGAEVAVVARHHDSHAPKIGLDVVYKNRPDSEFHGGVGRPDPGANGFNDKAAALQISSQPRSRTGEYSGWPTGITFLDGALDRSRSQPYTAVMDLSKVTVDSDGQSPYVFVWRAPGGLVGMKFNPASSAIEFYRDIDRLPRLVGSIPLAP